MQKFLQMMTLFLAMCLSGFASAQSLAEYTLNVSQGTFSSIATTGTSLTFSSTDDGYASFTLPFAFQFGESSLNAGASVALSANGFIYLGSSSTSGTLAYVTNTANLIINPILNSDGHMARFTGAGCYWEYDTDNGVVTIEYNGLGSYSSPYNYFTFQVKLYATGTIEFVYDSVNWVNTSNSMKTFLRDGPNGDMLAINDAWATPTVGTTPTDRPTDVLPTSGLTYTIERPLSFCPRPYNVVASSITPDGLEFTWTAGDQETEWEVRLDNDVQTVYTNTVSYSDLDANTEYTFSVRAVCGYDDTSRANTLTVRTACGYLTSLPFMEDFEGQSTSSSSTGSATIPCWNLLNNGTSYGNYPYVNNSTSYNHTTGGSKGLYWYNSTTAGTYGDYQCLVLPEVDPDFHPVSDLMVRFWAKASASSYHPVFYIGVMGNADSVETFQPTDTIQVEGTNWVEYESSLSGFEGNGNRIAIMAVRPSSSWEAYVDDISIDLVPDCPHVVDLDATIASDSVIVTWTEAGDATSWQVFASTSASTIAQISEDEDAGDFIDVYEETYAYTDFVNGTRYYIYVRPDCGGSYGPWYGPVSVVPGSVNMPVTGTMTVTGCNLAIYDDGGAEGNYSVNCNGTLVVYPSSIDSLIRVYGSYNIESNFEHLTIYEGVGMNGNVLAGPVTGTGVIDTLTSFAGPITINFTSDGSVVYAGFELFTQCIAAPECGDVTDVTVTTGPNSALVSWNPPFIGEYGGATVEYKEASDANWTTLNTTDSYIGITGLDTLTTYDVRVQTICSEGNANAWVTTQFTTRNYGCRVSDPNGSHIDTIGNGTTADYTIPLNNFYNNSFSEQLFLSTELSGAGNITGIDFQYAGAAASTVKNDCYIYVATTSNTTLSSSNYLEPSAMTLVYAGNMNCTPGWNHFEFTEPFNYDGGSNLLIAVLDNSGSYDGSSYTFYTHAASGMAVNYFDDMDIYSNGSASSVSLRNNIIIHMQACAELETCPAPILSHVEGIAVDQIQLSWVPGNTETSWNVYYRAAGDSVYALAGVATTNTYTVSNLQASSEYEFKVASICGSIEGGADTVSCWTECGLVAVPFTEDFEGEDYGQFSRPCWTAGTTNLGTNYPYPYVISLTGDPNKLCLIYNGAYLVLPEFSAPLNTLQARFTLVQGGTNVRLALGLLSNIDAPISSMVAIDTLIRSNIDSVNSSVNVTYRFDHLDNTVAGHLVFYDAWSDNYSFIDNLVIETIPNCTSIEGVTVSNITSTSADVSWNVGGTATTSYLVEYGQRGFAPGTGTQITTSTTGITLSNLNSGFTYDVYVSAICAATGDTSYASNLLRFATECAAATLPYTMNFDNVAEAGTTTSPLPNCWNYVMTSTGSYAGASYVPAVYYTTSAGQTSSGNYCLRLYGNSITVLPEMPTTVDSLMISFYEYNSSPSYYRLIVGAVDSVTPGFEASFVAIDTLVANGNANNYFLFLNSYQGTGRYIAFKNYYENSTSIEYSYHYIDDVVVERIPSCIYPMNFSTVAATTTTVDIAWTTSNANDYEYEYGVTGFTRGNGTTGYCTGSLASITGLTIGTSYDIYVRGICDVDDTSDWSAVYTFSTLNADPAIAPYTCDFSDTTLTNCGFEIVNDAVNAWYVGAAESNGTANALYVSNNNGVSSSYTNNSIQVSYAYRFITFNGGEYSYSYDWKAYGESNYDYIRVWLAPVSANLVAGHLPDGTTSTYSYYSSNPAGWISLDGGSKLNLQSSWQTYSAETIVPAGTYKLVFMWCNDGSGGTDPAGCIDNIMIFPNTCPKVQNLTASNVSASSFDLTWVDTVSGIGWQVEVGPVGFAHGDASATLATTTTPSYTAAGLSALTNYDVYVRHICSTTDTGMWNKISVQTALCDGVTVVENWDSTASMTTSNYFPGYSLYKYSISQVIIDSADIAASGVTDSIIAFGFNPTSSNYGTYFTNCDVYLANVTATDLSSGFINYDSTSWIKVIDNGDLCFTTTGWQLHGFSHGFLWDGTSNILLTINRKHGSYSSSASFQAHNTSATKGRYAYNDNGAYDPSSLTGGTSTNIVANYRLYSCGASCSRPTLSNVTNINYEHATINWTGNASDYEVALSNHGVWSAETAVSNAYTYTFTNLAPATTYQYRVRAICDASEGLISDWAMGTFTTDSLPCMIPANVEVTNIQGTSATLAWTPQSTENQWMAKVWNTTMADSIVVTAATANFTNLLAGVEYRAAVKALCGNGNVHSNWSDTITFTTVECQPVTGVQVTNVSNSSATISWTNNAQGATQWRVEYGEAGYASGEETVVTVSQNPYTINGLDANTNYEVNVTAICGDQWVSVPTSPVPFTTENAGIDAVDGINVTIYPNPAQGMTTISLTGVEGQVELSIVDMSGRRVMSESVECASADCVKTINVESLAQGAYFVRINGENINMVKKLIVK